MLASEQQSAAMVQDADTTTTAMLCNLLSPVWVEVIMSTLALACYLLIHGGMKKHTSRWKSRKVPARLKKGVEAVEESPAEAAAVQESRRSRAETGTQLVHRALCHGRMLEALQQFSRLQASTTESCAASLLSALAREPQLSDEVTQALKDLAGRFDAKALEVAAADIHRGGEWLACRRLLHIAGLLSIPETKRTMALIVRGHGAEPAAMRTFIEETSAESALSKDFWEAMLALSAAASAAVSEHEPDWPRRELPMYAKGISTFGKEGQLDKAIGIFNGLRCSTPPNAIVCNCLLDACVHCDDMPVAIRCFEEMKHSGLADVVSYNTLLKGHAAKGEVEAARELLKEMAALQLTASCITYHAVLHAMVQRGDRQGMWEWVEQMQAAGHAANVVTCSILLKIVKTPSHAADLKRILKLVDETVEPSDEVLFGALAEACIRVGNLDLLSERTQAFAALRGLGKIYAPTYGSMIKAYGQAGNLERVWALWREMLTQEVTPTAITLGCMVEALVMNRCPDDAWHLTNEVWQNEEQRPFVNTVIYSTILKGFAMTRQHDKVTVLNEEMKQRGIPKNKITYNTILNSMALCGLMHRVPEVLADMREAEPRVDPDVVTYSTLIKGYCKSGDLDKSLDLFRQMREEAKLAPDELLYNSLLDGCTRQNRLQDASRILQEMLEAKIKPSNYTLSIVTRFLGRARRLDQAFSMVDSLSAEFGFTPNVQVYTCLMQACFDNQQPAKALALHDRVVRQGVVPDEKLYTALVRGCLHTGETEKAALVVRCAYHLPSPGMQHTRGPPQCVEARWVSEVLGKLGRTSVSAARELEKALQATGFQGSGRKKFSR